MNKEVIEEEFKLIQDEICSALENFDGKSKFQEDIWERSEGGGGRTRIIQDGQIFEKGGVNFSAVKGELSDPIKKHLGIEATEFFATGVSIVIHPNHPKVPIIHMNIRYFEAGEYYWFGGGIDLTPHYVFPEDATFFHQNMKDVCDKYDESYYPKFKEWADNYFYIKHREETRGVGGIFFDRLSEDENHSKEDIFDFVCSVGRSFAPTYLEIVNRNKEKSYTEANQIWQRLRRGRYVEFNLVYDRGTKFGLDSNGRIESILMSLPKDASWYYNVIPQPNSEEEFTIQQLKKGIDWISN